MVAGFDKPKYYQNGGAGEKSPHFSAGLSNPVNHPARHLARLFARLNGYLVKNVISTLEGIPSISRMLPREHSFVVQIIGEQDVAAKTSSVVQIIVERLPLYMPCSSCAATGVHS